MRSDARNLSKALFLGAVILACASQASPAKAADAEKHGAIYYVNATDQEHTVQGRYILDQEGDKVVIRGSWLVKAKQKAYLADEGKKIVAQKFVFAVETEGGTSEWTCSAKALDGDGDFVITFSADNLAQHRKANGKVDEKPKPKGDRTKEAWDQMRKVNAETAPIAKRDMVEYWEKFNVGHRLIDRDDVDEDLERVIRDWIEISSSFHEHTVKYTRNRKSLENQLTNLGRCPLDDAGEAFIWGLAAGVLNRQISDLDKKFKEADDRLAVTMRALEKREGELAKTLSAKYPHRFKK